MLPDNVLAREKPTGARIETGVLAAPDAEDAARDVGGLSVFFLIGVIINVVVVTVFVVWFRREWRRTRTPRRRSPKA